MEFFVIAELTSRGSLVNFCFVFSFGLWDDLLKSRLCPIIY